MPDYLLLMHDDARELGNKRRDDWGLCIDKLQASGNFQGGSPTPSAPSIGNSLSRFVRA